MISLEEAIRRIDGAVDELPMVLAPLSEAVGACLGEDVIAPFDVPGFASSAMDGVAVRASDLKGNGPWKLPIQAVIAAGDLVDEPLLPMNAVRIMTGALLLSGADSVIPIENVRVEDGKAVIEIRPEKGSFVRPAGDDITEGQQLCGKGDVLGVIDVGVLASIGLSEVEIVSVPRIALISTGSEIVEPGNKLRPGQIYNTNNIVLQAMLKSEGYDVNLIKKISHDDVDVLQRAIKGCLDNSELIISTGGVSKGDFDFIPEAIRKLGGEILFHGVSVKPGKPTIIAKIRERWIIGLPGNPVSAVVGYHLFVKMIISRMQGCSYRPRTGWAMLEADLSIEGDRFCIVGARLRDKGGNIAAIPSQRQTSGRLSSIAGINGFIMVEGGSRIVPKGTEVDIEWL